MRALKAAGLSCKLFVGEEFLQNLQSNQWAFGCVTGIYLMFDLQCHPEGND